MKIKSAKYIPGGEIKITLENAVTTIICNKHVDVDTMLLKYKNGKYYLNAVWIPNNRLEDFSLWEYNYWSVKFIDYSKNELNDLINYAMKDIDIIPLNYINIKDTDKYYNIKCIDDVLDLRNKLSLEDINKEISSINYKFSKKCGNDTGLNSSDFLNITNSLDYIKKHKGTLLDFVNHLEH